MEKTQSAWYMDDLRAFCIRNNFYNAGTNDDYDLILRFVAHSLPTQSNIWLVAQDLKEHTRNNRLTTREIAERLEAQIVYRIPLVEWEQRTIL